MFWRVRFILTVNTEGISFARGQPATPCRTIQGPSYQKAQIAVLGQEGTAGLGWSGGLAGVKQVGFNVDCDNIRSSEEVPLNVDSTNRYC